MLPGPVPPGPTRRGGSGRHGLPAGVRLAVHVLPRAHRDRYRRELAAEPSDVAAADRAAYRARGNAAEEAFTLGDANSGAAFGGPSGSGF